MKELGLIGTGILWICIGVALMLYIWAIYIFIQGAFRLMNYRKYEKNAEVEEEEIEIVNPLRKSLSDDLVLIRSTV